MLCLQKLLLFFNPNFRSCESIYSKNNNYLLMAKADEYDKILALAKNHGFKTVVSPKKKIVSYNKYLYNIAILSNDIFWD